MSVNILLAFKAGRAIRRENTNWVDPSPEKGAIVLQRGEDDLLHFLWKNRSTGEAEEDLILFPTDATFVKVPQAPGGRVFVLKFSSSNQRHFFWMQDLSPQRDEEFVNNLNMMLEDPDRIPVWASGEGGAPAATSSTDQANIPSYQRATPEQLAQLRNLVAHMSTGTSPEQDISLTQLLTPANLTPLFIAHPDLLPSLFPHLPPDLPTPPNEETLQAIIQSPQFRQGVRNFDLALRTGMLGELVRQLGLPEEAGMGVAPFLRAIQEQSDRERERESQGEGDEGDRMDTD